MKQSRVRPVDALWFLLALSLVLATGAFARDEITRRQSGNQLLTVRHIEAGSTYANTGNLVGNPRAPVRIVEFTDFECVHCRRFQKTLADLLARDPDLVAVVSRQFPVSSVGYSVPAAIAAECAAAQGRFREFSDLIFAGQDTLSRLSLEKAAVLAGIRDTSTFRACRNDGRARDAVNRDIEAGLKLGINATPSFLIGDQMLIGEQPLDKLEAAVRAASPRSPSSR